MTGAKIDGQQFIALNTDFGYDALGGFGKVGSQLGTHSIEVLEAPKARQSDRIAGPPQTVGRWFSKLLDMLTPHSFRQQGKFQRGLEDFSALTGRLLGKMADLHALQGADSLEVNMERQRLLKGVRDDLAALRSTAEPMTSRGVSIKELIDARVNLSMHILRDENGSKALESIVTDGALDAMVNEIGQNLQGDMLDDLESIRKTLHQGVTMSPNEDGTLRTDGISDSERFESFEKLIEAQTGPPKPAPESPTVAQPSGQPEPASPPETEASKPPEQPKADSRPPAETKPQEQPKAESRPSAETRPPEQPKAESRPPAETRPPEQPKVESRPPAETKPPEPALPTEVELRELLKSNMPDQLEKSVKARAEVLQQKQADAATALRTALDMIHSTLDENQAAADPASFDRVRAKIEELMQEAMKSASDDALLRMGDTSRTVGREGRDYSRKAVDSAQIQRNLDSVRAAVREGRGLPTSPQASASAPNRPEQPSGDLLRDAMRETRDGVNELCALYANLLTALDQSKLRFERLECAKDVLKIAQEQQGDDARQNRQYCTRVLDALLKPDGKVPIFEMAILSQRNLITPELRRRCDNLIREAMTPSTAASRNLDELHYLERSRALHQAATDAGALLSEARVPHNDLGGQALQISALAQKIASGGTYAELIHLQRQVARFVAGLAQSRMQVVCPDVASDTLVGGPQAGIPAEGREKALAVLSRLQDSVVLMVENLETQAQAIKQRNSQIDISKVKTVMEESLLALEAAEQAARKCSEIVKPGKAVKEALEQLAESVSSGRADGADALKELLKDKVWEKDPKAREAKGAIETFLALRGKLITGRDQNEVLTTLDNTFKEFNIVPHDFCFGLDGQLRMLVNRVGLGHTNELRWVNLPNPPKPLTPDKIREFAARKDDGVPDRFKKYFKADLRVGTKEMTGVEHYATIHDTLKRIVFDRGTR